MPYAFLHISAHKHFPLTRVRAFLRTELPGIIAKELSVGGREVHEGGLTADEIMLWPIGSTDMAVVGGKDVEIVIFAHPFPERMQNIEERKEAIIRELQKVFEAAHVDMTFAVCIIMMPMAYGEARVTIPTS